MRVLFVLLLALTLAVVTGSLVAEDPGFVVIGYGGKVVRTTFAFFALVTIVFMIALYAAIRAVANVLELRRRWRRWSEEQRRRRAHRSLASGLLALASGDFARAERLFSRGVDERALPEVHYLAAAEAAQAMHASARRDNYLRLAHDLEPQADAAIGIKRAEWMVENGQLEQAREWLDRLASIQPGNPRVLELRRTVLERTGDHEALLALVPALRRDRVVSFDEANAIEEKAAVAVLERPFPDGETLRARWRAMSRPVRARASVLAAYARALCRLGCEDEAETVVRKQLEAHWDTDLAALYGEIRCEPPTKQLRRADGWAVTRPDDPGLILNRARLSIRAGLWGQARKQLERLLDTGPSPLLYRLLAEAAEGMGDAEAASAYRRSGLELATGAEGAVPPAALTRGAA